MDECPDLSVCEPLLSCTAFVLKVAYIVDHVCNALPICLSVCVCVCVCERARERKTHPDLAD